jgi:hypothetical protein
MRRGEANREAPARAEPRPTAPVNAGSGGASPYRAGVNAGSDGASPYRAGQCRLGRSLARALRDVRQALNTYRVSTLGTDHPWRRAL